MRLAVVIAVAVPLAVADLVVKAGRATPDWAYHQRSPAWLLACALVLLGAGILTRVPSTLVPPAAGILVGGVLGNAISAAANGLDVPNPIVITTEDAIVAFNLADVWVVLGLALLLGTLAIWLVQNRSLLPEPRGLPAAIRRSFGRRP